MNRQGSLGGGGGGGEEAVVFWHRGCIHPFTNFGIACGITVELSLVNRDPFDDPRSDRELNLHDRWRP